jgi:hypothetical protein
MAIALGEAVDAGYDGSRVVSRLLEGGRDRIWETLQDTSVMQSYAISNMASRSQINSSLMRNVFLSPSKWSVISRERARLQQEGQAVHRAAWLQP